MVPVGQQQAVEGGDVVRVADGGGDGQPEGVTAQHDVGRRVPPVHRARPAVLPGGLIEEACRNQRSGLRDLSDEAERLGVVLRRPGVLERRDRIAAGVVGHVHHQRRPEGEMRVVVGGTEGGECLRFESASLDEPALRLGQHRPTARNLEPGERSAHMLRNERHLLDRRCGGAQVALFERRVEPPQMRPHLHPGIARLATEPQHSAGEGDALRQPVGP